jgi:hypothetical protein
MDRRALNPRVAPAWCSMMSQDSSAAVSHTFYSSACMSSMSAPMATVGTGQVDPIQGSVATVQFHV